MKTSRKFNLLVLGLVGSLSMGTYNACAELEVGASVSISATADFEAPLSSRGMWVEVGTYGRCWRPRGVLVSWRPYCDGHWEWTDCGWYWVSDEPWAWACYHYGYWVYDAGYGWVWIPGIEWGPAWVSWRVGGGYIGWAPLAPRHVSVVSAHFVFVQGGRFCDRVRPSTVIVNNTTIINKTTVINNGVRREDRDFGTSGKRTVVVNEGPGVAVVEKASGKKLKATSVQEVDRRTVVPEQVSRGKGKPADRSQEAAPSKPSVEPGSKAKVAPGSTPAPDQPRNPGRDPGNRWQPDKERESGRPAPPIPERPAPSPSPERKLPGEGHRPNQDSVTPPPQPGPPGPLPKDNRPSPGRGKEKRNHEQPEKHGKD